MTGDIPTAAQALPVIMAMAAQIAEQVQRGSLHPRLTLNPRQGMALLSAQEALRVIAETKVDPETLVAFLKGDGRVWACQVGADCEGSDVMAVAVDEAAARRWLDGQRAEALRPGPVQENASGGWWFQDAHGLQYYVESRELSR